MFLYVSPTPPAAARAQSKLVQLRFKYRINETKRYVLRISMNSQNNMSGVPIGTESTTVMRLTVLSVNKGGTATLKSVVESNELFVNKQRFGGGGGGIVRPEIVRISSRGVVRGGRKATTKDFGATMMMDPSDLVQISDLPESPVAVGSIWPSSPSPAYSLSNKLTGVERNVVTVQTSGVIDVGKLIAKGGKGVANTRIEGKFNINYVWKFDLDKGDMRGMVGGGSYALEIFSADSKPGTPGLKMDGRVKLAADLRR